MKNLILSGFFALLLHFACSSPPPSPSTSNTNGGRGAGGGKSGTPNSGTGLADDSEASAIVNALQELAIVWAVNKLRAVIKTSGEFKNNERNDVRLSDVMGCNEAKHELVQILEFIKNPQRFHDLGATIPKGVLLVGPPGTGKTLMAKAMAGEAGIPFISLSGSDFSSEWAGVGTAMVKRLFAKARKLGRCIIFIDEIDTIGRKRSGKDSAIAIDSESTLNQLLVEMDGFAQKSAGASNKGRGLFGGKKKDAPHILILAGTNRAEMLDKALTRAGRFDRIVNVDPPDVAGRKELFNKYMGDLPLASFRTDASAKEAAKAKERSKAAAATFLSSSSPPPSSFSSWFRWRSLDADPSSSSSSSSPVARLWPWGATNVSHAAAAAAPVACTEHEEGVDSELESAQGDADQEEGGAVDEDANRLLYAQAVAEMTPGFTGAQVANLCNEAALRCATLRQERVTLQHFSDALDRMIGGLERAKYVPVEELKRTAVHEAGHALAAWMCTHSAPPLKVSVVWRGDSLGFTQLKGLERHSTTEAVLRDEMVVLLGGRVAEELVFGDPSMGASHDLQRVTDLAYHLVGSGGYSDKIGLMSVLGGREGGGRLALSDETAKLVDSEARRVVGEAYVEAKKLLKKHKLKLLAMADELVTREVLQEQDIHACFGPRPAAAVQAAAVYDSSRKKERVTTASAADDAEQEEAEQRKKDAAAAHEEEEAGRRQRKSKKAKKATASSSSTAVMASKLVGAPPSPKQAEAATSEKGPWHKRAVAAAIAAVCYAHWVSVLSDSSAGASSSSQHRPHLFSWMIPSLPGFLWPFGGGGGGEGAGSFDGSTAGENDSGATPE